MSESGAKLKIRKFRIRPRIPTVKRILKSLLEVRQLPTGTDEMVALEAQNFVDEIMPTAFYQTWARDEVPEEFRSFLDEAGFGKAVSVSALVATVGAYSEEKIAACLMNGETNRSHVLTALGEESADLSLSFLLRLLGEDARQDDCEVTEPLKIKDESFLPELLSDLQAEDEGVTLDTANHLSPRFTRVALVPWLPVSKKKRQGFTSKKR